MKVLILIILEYIYICYSYDSVVAINRLNPYYTGIHLHETAPSERIADPCCLNPYYTGIHLHTSIEPEIKRYDIVLILIILEYIYIY